MTNKELIELNNVLDQVSHIKGKQFAYAVFKNKSLIEEELKIFEKLKRDPHPQYQDYENERTILCITHSKKDDNGEPVINAGKYDIEDLGVFQKEFDELKVKYQEVFDDLKQAEDEYNDFLNDESKCELVKVSVSDLPDDIDAQFLMALKHMIK